MECTHEISSFYPAGANGSRECSMCGYVIDAAEASRFAPPAPAPVPEPVTVDPMLAVGTEIGTLRSRVSSLESFTSSLSARVDGLQASVSGVSTRVADLSSLSADVAGLKAADVARVQTATEAALAGTVDALAGQ